MARSNNILLFITLLAFIAIFDFSEKWAFQEIEETELFSCPDFGANFAFSNEPKYSGKLSIISQLKCVILNITFRSFGVRVDNF